MDVPLPPIAVNAALFPFAIVAVSMILVTIFLFGKVLPADGHPPLVTQMVLALAVLGGGSVLLLSLVFVYINPNATEAWTWVLLGFNFMMMFPAGIWFVGLVLFRDRRVDLHGWAWPVMISAVTTGTEALMGVLFALAGAATTPTLLESLALGLTSVWFFWSMAAVMSALVLWAPLGRTERSALVALTASAVLAPWVTTVPTVGGAAMGALMVAVFLLLVRQLARGQVVPTEVPLLFGLVGAFLAMAVAGVFVAAAGGTAVSDLTFGTTMGVVMAVEIAYLFRRFYHGAAFAPWVPRRGDVDVPAPPGISRVGAKLDPRPTEAPAAGR
ncbi:MAG: hypothetical protein ABSB97_05855 [Thermoplasmata archaeon]|jgi:hypothetical protein